MKIPFFGVIFFLSLISSYFHTIFGYSSRYTLHDTEKRAHSIVQLKELACTILLIFLSIILTKEIYLFIVIALSILLVKNYLDYMPYFSPIDNFVVSSIWIITILLSIFEILILIGANNFACLVSFLLLCPAVLVVYWEVVKKTYTQKAEIELNTPYALDSKIRFLFYNKKKLLEEDITEIRKLFKKSTKRFISFKLMFIWESNFELFITGNYEVAIMKLLKYWFSTYKVKNIELKQKNIKYSPDLECQYYFYAFFKHLYHNTRYSKLLTYLYHFNIYKKLELSTSIRLLKLFELLLNFSSNNLSRTRVHCRKVFKKLENCSDYTDKCIKKHGKSSEIENSYMSLLNLLCLTETEMFTGNFPFSDNLMHNIVDESSHDEPTIIINGIKNDFGKILYANPRATEVFKLKKRSSKKSRNLLKLFVQPFDKQFKDEIINFLLFSHKSRLVVKDMFFFDNNNLLLKYDLAITICSCKQESFFIINFIISETKGEVIFYSPVGEIISYSNKLIKTVKGKKYIQDILPSDFYFQDNYTTSIFMSLKKTDLNISIKKIDMYGSFFYYISLDGLNAEETVSTISMSLKIEKSKHRIYSDYEKQAKSTKSSNSISEKNRIMLETQRIKRLVKLIKFLTIILIIFLLSAEITSLFFLTEMIDNANLSFIIKDIGVMRYFVTSIGLRTKSSKLWLEGYETGLNITQYSTILNLHISTLESLLYGLKYYENSYPVEQTFKDAHCTIYDYHNNTVIKKETNLFQGLIEFISKSYNLLEKKFLAPDDAFDYIYQNSHTNLLKALNDTIYKDTIGILQKVEYLFNIIKIMGISSIILITLLFLVFAGFLVFLEKINKAQWKNISGISCGTITSFRQSISNHIKKNHAIDIDMTTFSKENPNIYVRLSRFIIFSSSVFLIIAISFFLVRHYVCEIPLKELVKIRASHMFWAGVRRPMTARTFLWGRELFLEIHKQKSYINELDFYQIPSLEFMFNKSCGDLEYMQRKLFSDILDLDRQHNAYSDYVNILSVNACDYVKNVTNCTSISLNKGLNSALDGYMKDLNWLLRSGKEDWKFLGKLERQALLIEGKFTDGLFLFSNVTNTQVKYYKNLEIQISYGFIIIIIGFFIVSWIQVKHFEIDLLGQSRIIFMLKQFRRKVSFS
ncbi:hypothetical protein SteCoe_18460 [Stentor coeruleus]|uniref:Uncharacterized protein n=1 Tax=Stentor coeruleus TaxID=5963 RepID=A0A1R2BX11_9CILI|nr:hypothetical protein SteCoe_18460 [Stentor coeruleus]